MGPVLSMSGQGGGDMPYIGLDSTMLFHWSEPVFAEQVRFTPPHEHGEFVPTGSLKRLHPRREEDLGGGYQPQDGWRSS